MAKGTVTAADLEEGIKGIGGFGSLASNAQRAKRDSPFGSEYVKNTAHSPEVIPQVVIKQEMPDTLKVEEVVPPVKVEPTPINRAMIAVAATKPQKERVLSSKKNLEEKDLATQSTAQPKAVLFSEKVTIQMSATTRDRLLLLAAQLQRRKTSKTERITANTLMRVAIETFLDEVTLDGEIINSEEDLMAVVKKKVRGAAKNN